MVGEMEYLDMALKETERMRTITSLLMRVVKEPITVGEYKIPEGWLAFICPPVTHRLPEIYSNPDTYDPLRFSPLSGMNNSLTACWAWRCMPSLSGRQFRQERDESDCQPAHAALPLGPGRC